MAESQKISNVFNPSHKTFPATSQIPGNSSVLLTQNDEPHTENLCK